MTAPPGPAFNLIALVARSMDRGRVAAVHYVFLPSCANLTITVEALNDALRLAIRAHFKFEREDFHRIDDFAGGRYSSSCVFRPTDESWYGLACECRNTSAAASWECATGRKPFRLPQGCDVYNDGGYGHRSPQRRLFIGARFKWGRLPARVTSIDDAAGTLIACSYRDIWDGPVTKRHRLSREDVARGGPIDDLDTGKAER